MQFERKVYLQKLIDRQNDGLIKVITGARRSGKSYLINKIFYQWLLSQGIENKNIVKFAFDSDEDLDSLDDFLPAEQTKIKNGKVFSVNSKKFRYFLKSKTNENERFYLLLDEVQLLDNFTGTLNGLLRHENYEIYVTGSNSRFLSSDIATEFKGRCSVIHILPLTFSEYCTGLNLDPKDAWKSYIITGGIPLVALMKTEQEKIEYLQNLCDETYLKDIVSRNRIKKTQELSDVFDILASSIGCPINCLKVSNTFESVTKKKISDDTVSDYINYFRDAFIVSKALKFNIKGRKYIGSPFKIYFEDIGVCNARLNFRQIEESHIMENIVYNELRYRGYNVDVGEIGVSEKTGRKDVNGQNIYSQKMLEVDFIATRGSEKLYIQSVLKIDSPEKEAQEKRSLYCIDDSFRKIVITKNELNKSLDEKGIEKIDLFDFLLEDSPC